MIAKNVVVVGGGIAGLTASALLAHEGFSVILFEAHTQLGGCAGTFRRGSYVFDVGATQVAGLETGGIHQRLFKYLNSPIPQAHLLDPACIVDLGDNSEPIHLWYNQQKWQSERERHFPGSESFWSLCAWLHKSNWGFVERDPVLPVGNLWDIWQLTKALRPETICTSVFSRMSIADLLKLCRCDQDKRLKKFLDIQLKLYSQESADQTAALYGATVLQMAQEPRGLWHLNDSMQALSDLLEKSFLRDGGKLMLGRTVNSLVKDSEENDWEIQVSDKQNNVAQFHSSNVIFSLPPQLLLDLIPTSGGMTMNYRQSLESLPVPTGALVFYGAIHRSNLPENCPNHIQLLDENLDSLFISISSDGDGRAPSGQATVIASAFTNTKYWLDLSTLEYQCKKEKVAAQILSVLNQWLDLSSGDWLHQEVATPKSFKRWTGRPNGSVGGIPQTPSHFGPFGLPSRTPLAGLWLCGDSIYPGEGTAGVSQSALMACRQLMASQGRHLDLSAII